MGRFLEADAPRQLAQVIAANDELPRLSVDMAEAGLRGNNTVETARLYRAVDETAFTNW
jgi:hypothetical protein